MAKISKRMASICEELKTKEQSFSLESAIDCLREISKNHGVKFEQTVDLILVLGIDPRKMNVRGSVSMPNSTGKSLVVCCYTNDEDPKAIIAMGADAAGGDDLMQDIIEGRQKCDMLLTFKKEMAKVGKFGRQLGGKGLMPNPKDGTIADDLESLSSIITGAKKGIAQFRNDKAGIVHVAIGKINASNSDLIENLKAIVAEVKRLKPVKAKGKYLQKIYLSTTMGPSVLVASSEVE